MSFKENTYMQISMNDSFERMSERSQKAVMKSWAGLFAEHVFPAINEKRFAVLYSANAATRPNAPINVIVGGLILKELCGQSDDELIESIICDVRYQYALHTTSFEEQPVSDRTFSRFRERLYRYEQETGIDLLKDELAALTEVFARFMNLAPAIKRMDSLMIASRCKNMSRLEIVYTVVSNAVRLLKRLGQEELISAELTHYLNEDDHNEVIYRSKGEEADNRLETAVREASLVMKIMSGEEWAHFEEYQLLARVLEEQTNIGENGERAPKENRDINSSSLQNPSDPDATFRKKAGDNYQGYVGNIVETVGENGDSLITDAAFDVNIHSDSAFCGEYLESRTEDAPAEVLITDGAYGGFENEQLAKEKNVELVATALSGKEPDEIYADFKLNEDAKTVLQCPAGNEPIRTTYHEKTETIRAVFSCACCENCPYFNRCNPTKQKKSYVIRISRKKVARAAHVRKLTTKKYKAYGRMRNGVEGVMSILRRKYDVDDIPVFGIQRMKMFFWLKLAAYNFTKFSKCARRRKGSVRPKTDGNRISASLFPIVRIFCKFVPHGMDFIPSGRFRRCMAAGL